MNVGFRFHPNDNEIISHYLMNKIQGNDHLVDHVIGLVDVYQWEPWNLPQQARRPSDDRVWYFFCRLELSNGGRANRRTRNGTGFWKVTGKTRDIMNSETGEIIGNKKTLVFYAKVEGSPPIKTDWVIHEYHIIQIANPNQMVLCKLKYKGDEIIPNLPQDEGEPSHLVNSDHNSQTAQAEILEVGPEVGSNHPYFVQSQMQVEQSNPNRSTNQSDSSEEEVDLVAFSDAFLNDEAIAASLLDDDCINLVDTDVVQTEAFQSKGFQQLQTSQDLTETLPPPNLSALAMPDLGLDDIRTIGASSVGSSVAAPQIKRSPEVHQIFTISTTPMPQLHTRKEIYSESIIRLLSEKASNLSRDKAKETAKLGGTLADPAQKKSFGGLSEKDRKMVHSKPENNKLRSTGSSTNESKSPFLGMDTIQSSNATSPPPPSVYLVNILIGLVLFIIIIREMLIFH